MKRYTEINTFRSTKKQKATLKKMKSYNVDVGNFIRNAIKEKINRDYADLIPKENLVNDPFLEGLELAIYKLNNR